MNRFLPIFCIIFLCISAATWGEGADSFGSISDYLDGIYGIDDNAGLTAFPVLNVPMGGRSEGMTAFTAVSDDISFIEYNPAGSSMLERTEMAFFHNNWIADTKVEGAIFATRMGNWGISGGLKWLYLPFTQYNAYGERTSKGYYSESVAILNTSYTFLENHYFSGVSVGMNLKGAFRFVPDYADSNDNLISGSGKSQSAAMAMADIGALTRFDFLKLYNAVNERNASAAVVIRNIGPPALDDPLPTVVVAAFAYKPMRPWQLAFDFFLPFNMSDPTLSEKPYWAAATTVNVAKFLSMHLGVLSKAGSARVTVGSAIIMEKIALDVNYSLDLLTQLQPMNRVSLGVRFDLGDQGRGEISRKVNELYLLGLDAYALAKYAEAEVHFKEALRLNPRYAPAKEALQMIARLEAIDERIDSMQRLDF